MDAISDLPMPHDMDADYSPQYVKLARILRGKIEAGELNRTSPLPSPRLANEYGVSIRVAQAALAMLAANRYVTQPGNSGPYRISWQAVPSMDEHVSPQGDKHLTLESGSSDPSIGCFGTGLEL